jgi:hypothetical protein
VGSIPTPITNKTGDDYMSTNLNRYEYTYFTNNEYENIIGESISKRVEDRGENMQSLYLIIYVGNLIKNYIFAHTGKHLYKEYEDDPNVYKLYQGLVRDYTTKLTDEQVRAIKLACIYQLDYILDVGSTERMSGIGAHPKAMGFTKQYLKEFEICSISRQLLANAGLLYSGIGGGVYAWVK